MTKRLDETFDIENAEYQDDQDIQCSKKSDKSVTELIAESSEILNALTSVEKVDNALASVSGLNEHDDDMDEISDKALSSYKDLCDLGLNVPDANAARIFEVAATMLKTAMEAKDAKVNRKLKTIELQLKKAKLDWDMSGNKDNNTADTGQEFDRNDLLARLVESKKEKSEKTENPNEPN